MPIIANSDDAFLTNRPSEVRVTQDQALIKPRRRRP
jgi:hypothetical protein